jgi:hypothetical protein
MSLRPKKSIVLAVQAEDFSHVKEGLRRVIKIVSANGASFWPKPLALEHCGLGFLKRAYPTLDLLGGYP